MGKTGLCGRVREEKIGIWAATLRGEVGKTRGEDEEHLIDGTSRTWKCTFILRKVQIFTWYLKPWAKDSLQNWYFIYFQGFTPRAAYVDYTKDKYSSCHSLKIQIELIYWFDIDLLLSGCCVEKSPISICGQTARNTGTQWNSLTNFSAGRKNINVKLQPTLPDCLPMNVVSTIYDQCQTM